MKKSCIFTGRQYDYRHIQTASRDAKATPNHRVEIATRAIGRSGNHGTGVAKPMKQAELIGGRLRAHFASLNEMLAKTIDRAGTHAVPAYSRIASTVPRMQSRQPMLRTSRAVTRRGMRHRTKKLIDVGSRRSDVRKKPRTHKRALISAAAIIEAVIVALAVDERALPDWVLMAAGESRLLGEPKELTRRTFSRHKL